MGSFPRPAGGTSSSNNPNHVQISRRQFFFFSFLARTGCSPSPSQSRNLVGLRARPGEAESLVGPELAEDAVASGAEGDGQDETDGEQLDGDLLEGTEALGDGVRWGDCVSRVLSAFPSERRVRTGVLLLLRYC
jgi:hypothetical protein